MKTYYSQRSGAGLIISEGTSPSPNGLGYPRIPDAYSNDQIEGWKSVAEGVHEQDGIFFVQLMHTGRVSTILNLPEKAETLAPSSILLGGEMHTDVKGMQPHDKPRGMSENDIVKVKSEYLNAATKLIEAGIDGIELYDANGYLLDQFLNPKTNKRTDLYGGGYKNRARLLLEIVKEIGDAIGGNKIGVRFSPYSVFNDMEGDYGDLIEAYIYLAKELSLLDVAYIHIADQQVAMGAPKFATNIKKTIKENFKGAVIVGGNVHTASQAEELINQSFDLVYVGRPFISNPDLVEKLKKGEALTVPDFDTAYTLGNKGYTDY